MVGNAQSTVSVKSGRNIIHLITSESLFFFFTVPDISQPSFGEIIMEKMKQNEPKKVGISRLEALAVGEACYARLFSYSKFKKREL